MDRVNSKDKIPHSDFTYITNNMYTEGGVKQKPSTKFSLKILLILIFLSFSQQHPMLALLYHGYLFHALLLLMQFLQTSWILD